MFSLASLRAAAAALACQPVARRRACKRALSISSASLTSSASSCLTAVLSMLSEGFGSLGFNSRAGIVVMTSSPNPCTGPATDLVFVVSR